MGRTFLLATALCASLSGCGVIVGGVVGASLTPFVQPIVDRALNHLGMTWVDPSNITTIRDYDAGKK